MRTLVAVCFPDRCRICFTPFLRHFRVEVRGKTWTYMRLIFLKMLVISGFIGFWRDIRSYKIRPVPSDT